MCLKCPALFGNISEGELAHSCHSPVPTEGLPSTRLWQQKLQESWRKWRPTQALPPFHHLTPPFICSYTLSPGANDRCFSLRQRGSPAMWKRNRTKEVCVCVFKAKQQWFRSFRFVPSRSSAVNWFTCYSSFRDFRPRERILVTQSGFEVSIQI